jgi:hypothetical protein
MLGWWEIVYPTFKLYFTDIDIKVSTVCNYVLYMSFLFPGD